jgi:hypothetical protein
LHSLLNAVYDLASYDLAIDYAHDPVPALSEAEQVWLHTWLTQQDLRSP